MAAMAVATTAMVAAVAAMSVAVATSATVAAAAAMAMAVAAAMAMVAVEATTVAAEETHVAAGTVGTVARRAEAVAGMAVNGGATARAAKWAPAERAVGWAAMMAVDGYALERNLMDAVASGKMRAAVMELMVSGHEPSP